MLAKSIFGRSLLHLFHFLLLSLHVKQHTLSFSPLPFDIRANGMILIHALFTPQPHTGELGCKMVNPDIFSIETVHSHGALQVLIGRQPRLPFRRLPLMLLLGHEG